jgi:hypothetical protein
VQCGAQPDEASKTLTRRPATHNRPRFTRTASTRSGLTADGSRSLPLPVHGLFQPWRNGIPGLPTDRFAATVSDWTRHGHGLTVDTAAVTASDCSRTRTRYGHGLCAAAEADCPRTNCGRGCGHGLDVATARLRTGHGPGSDTDCPWLRTSARPFARTNCDFTASIARTQKPAIGQE